MNFTKKMLLSLFMMTGFMPNSVYTSDLCDEQGRTPLMNYVIEQEQGFALRNKAIDQAFAACFGTGHVRQDYRYVKINKECLPVHKDVCAQLEDSGDRDIASKTLPKLPSCTDQTIQALCDAELDLELFLTATTKTIEAMLEKDMNLQARDMFGKTVLDYAFAPEIYNLLSAKASWTGWMYSNKNYIMAGAFVVVATTVGMAELLSITQSVKSSATPQPLTLDEQNIFALASENQSKISEELESSLSSTDSVPEFKEPSIVENVSADKKAAADTAKVAMDSDAKALRDKKAADIALAEKNKKKKIEEELQFKKRLKNQQNSLLGIKSHANQSAFAQKTYARMSDCKANC